MEKLLNAAELNNVDEIKKLLQDPEININLTNDYNETALTVAVIERLPETATFLLNHANIDLHIQGYLSGTPLTFAIFSEQIDLVKLLLEKEEKFDSSKHPGAINWALLNDQLEIIKLLNEKGANFNMLGLTGRINSPDWVWKPTPSPLSSPFHPEVINFVKYTPLYLAVHMGKVEAVDYLLKHCNVNPDLKNIDGQTPLLLAVRKNNKSIVQLLIDHGANPDLSSFLRERESNIINPEILAILDNAKNKKTHIENNHIIISSEPEFFKSSKGKIPEMLLEPYQEVFKTASMEIAEAEIPNTERKILNDILHEGVISPIKFIKFTKELLIPESLMLSLCILYCGLHNKWDDIPSQYRDIKNNLLDNTAKYSLSINSTQAQIEECITILKLEAEKICKEVIKKDFLSSEEVDIKNAILNELNQQENTVNIDEISPSSPRSFLQSYIDTYKNELEFIPAPNYLPKTPPKQSITLEAAHSLSKFSTEWQEIYALIQHPPKYNRLRDERQMFNVVKSILWRQAKNCSWKEVPAELDPGRAIYYYKRWEKEDILDKIFTIAAKQQSMNIITDITNNIKLISK